MLTGPSHRAGDEQQQCTIDEARRGRCAVLSCGRRAGVTPSVQSHLPMLSGEGAMREFKLSPRGANRMNKVTCGITMSLDAFVAGPNQSAEKPFGDIDETILHRW